MSQSHTETLVNNLKGVYDSIPTPSFGRDSHMYQIVIQRLRAKLISIQHKKIARWNVRKLHQNGKLENVIKEVDRIKFNILGLAEVRWTGAGSMKLDSTTLIYPGAHALERGVDPLRCNNGVKSDFRQIICS
ncbi:craniofacial development protein 2-like [Plakobranchus ocellatus]|uniref:Craniofacial development protein 2-like n=1 Tax=Plakobranchus ocellatus TaxID=259542 RepID=A0AAV3ZSK7_9GAST|nr:craniofacial development protein 2-like [Plakobranchus ocellatus]